MCSYGCICNYRQWEEGLLNSMSPPTTPDMGRNMLHDEVATPVLLFVSVLQAALFLLPPLSLGFELCLLLSH